MLSLNDAALIAQISSAIVVIAGVLVAIFQLTASNETRDFQSLFSLQKEIGEAWEKFLQTEESDDLHHFYFGQLMVMYETVCYAFNHHILGSKVEKYLCSQIIEVITRLATNPATQKQIRDLQSGEDTHKEICNFVKKHEKRYQEHWKYLIESDLMEQSKIGEEGNEQEV